MADDPGTFAVERLTERQREALRLYAANLRGKKAAAMMGGISENTIGGYLSDAARLLGTSREGAAAQLMSHEATHPNARGRFSVGDPEQPMVVVTIPAPEQPGAPEVPWIRLLPLRIGKGTSRDLSPALRIAWIVAVAIALALAFGQLAVGAKLLTDVFVHASPRR